MNRIKFYKGAFDNFMGVDINSLEKEITKSNDFLVGKTLFKNLREQRIHEGLQKRCDVLKLIMQLRKGEISTDDFEAQVRLFN